MSYVYFLQVDDVPGKPVKIGHTSRTPEQRRREWQQMMPFHKVKLIGSMHGDRNREAALHHLFNETMIVNSEVKESEWFYPSDFMKRYIDTHVCAIGK